MSDKPVYQWQHSRGGVLNNTWWQDCTEADFKARDKKPQFKVRIMYETRAIIESLKQENEAQAKRIAELETPLTHRQISSACLSFRHDFGLLEPEQQAALFSEAKNWEACFQKERDIAASKNGDSK